MKSIKRYKPIVERQWTAKQRQYQMWLADPLCDLTEIEIAKELGVARQSLYAWRQEPGFISDAYNQLDKNIHARLNKVFNGLLKKAENEDDRAARLIFEVLGKLGQGGSGNLNLGGSQNQFLIQIVEKNKKDIIEPPKEK